MDDSSVILNMFKTADNAVHVAPEEAVFKTGDAGDCLYVIRSGNAQVIVDGNVVEVVSDGDIVGEMSLIDGSPRSADLVAVSPCQVIPINLESFMELIRDTPFFAIYLMQALTRRLRQTGHMHSRLEQILEQIKPVVDAWPNMSEDKRAEVLKLAGG